MYVEICWKTEKTPKGKIYISKRMMVKEAMKKYKKEIEPQAIKAYLRHFDGWHNRLYRTLREDNA